jgi:Tfp pilus assembly protein PilF
VAWISDRKDLLSTFFGFSSIAAYVAYAKRPRAAPYVAALALFLLALMAKATMVILPVLLLLLDLWPLDRVGDRRRVLVEKLPFSALAALFGVIAVSVVRSLPETVEHGAQVAFANRAVNAVVSYARYLAKTIWPNGLAILYPHPNLPGGVPWATWHVAAAALVLLAITTGVAIERRRRPYLVVGWLWFVLGLFPIIGLLQIGPQAMADRYSYVPLVGIFLMVVWGGADLLAIAAPSTPAVRRMIGAGVALALAAFVIVTERQIATWRNSHTLFARALEAAPRSAVLHSNFAVILRSEGKTDEAIDHYRAALAVEDDLPQTHYNLGNALASRRDLDEAIAHYRRATELDPRFVMAHYNLGGALRSQGRFSDAAESYRRAVEVRPDFYQAFNDLGLTLHSLGQLDGATDAYRQALRIHASALTHRNLAKALAAEGRMDEANEELRKAATAPPK